MNEFIQNMEQGGSVRANGGTDLKYSGDDLSGYSSIFDNAVFKPNDEDMMRVIEAIKNLNAGTELEKYVDVDAVLRYFAANTALVNLDSYVSGLQHNYYLYENNGMISILPWDFNLAFAGFQAGDASAAVNFPVDTPVSDAELSERPLIGKLLEAGEYKEQYHEMLKEIAERYFKSGLFDDTIEKLDLLINNYVKNDRDAFFTYEQYEDSLPVLARFGSLRADSILAQLDGDMPSTAAGQKAEPEKLVEVQGLNLQAMGTQGGGMKGVVNFEMTGDIPAGFAGNAEGGRLAGDRKLPQGQLPQGQLPQGKLPEGQQSRLPRDQAAQMPGVQPGVQNDGGKTSGSTYIAEAKAGIVDSLSIPLIIVSAVTAALGILFAALLGRKRYI